MNIPETIRIGSCNYKILKTKHNIVLNGRQCYGAIDYDKHEIELSENIGDKQQIELTLLHELFHGIVFDRDIKTEDEEELVEKLAKGLHQVIVDNPKMFN